MLGAADSLKEFSDALGDLEDSRVETDTAETKPNPQALHPQVEVENKIIAVPDNNKGYQKLRAVAGLIPSIGGNGTRGAIESGLRNHEDPHAVLDVFATVEAQERGEARSADGDEA